MVILFDRFNLSNDFYETVFSTRQQTIVAKLLIDMMKKNKGTINKPEMSGFATKLHEGKITLIDEKDKKKIKVSYNKRQFYDRILTPMKSMGIIEYNLYKKTYHISDKFNKSMIRIGLQWLEELKKAPHTHIND